MDENLKRKAQKLVNNGGNEFLTQLEATLELGDKLDSVVEAIQSIPVPEPMEMPEHPTEMEISNLPEVQKVEIINLPEEKDDTETQNLLKELIAEVKKKEEYAYDIEIDSALKEQLRGKDGLDGKDGINGKDGKDGKDGTEITVEQIADKINSKENIINLTSIKGLEKIIQNNKSGTRTVYTNQQPSNRSFTYNSDGTLQSMISTYGTKTFTYNAAGQVTSMIGTGIYTSKSFGYSDGKISNVNLM